MSVADQPTAQFKIAALYKFAAIDEPSQLKDILQRECTSKNICGGLIIAKEGINGTISGLPQDVDGFLAKLQVNFLSPVEVKFSTNLANPFIRMRIHVKEEIISMGIPNLDPSTKTGSYIEPSEWNQLISDPDVIVVDTRNAYEVELGTFQRSVNPNTDTFKDFPAFVDSTLDPSRHRKIAMFCTGGIRCEKATSFMIERGFGEVYHLKGGILRYLETVPQCESMWTGECYVFDQRVTVTHGLQQGNYTACRACRHPLLVKDDLQHEQYEEGVSCRHCFNTLNEKQVVRAKERHLQIKLAEERHEQHLGMKLLKVSKTASRRLPYEQLPLESPSIEGSLATSTLGNDSEDISLSDVDPS